MDRPLSLLDRARTEDFDEPGDLGGVLGPREQERQKHPERDSHALLPLADHAMIVSGHRELNDENARSLDLSKT
jgi:hypothetical protein